MGQQTKLQALGPGGICLAMTTTAITTTMSPARHQLQHLQVVGMLLLLPQLPPQVYFTFSCECASFSEPVDSAANGTLHIDVNCCMIRAC